MISVRVHAPPPTRPSICPQPSLQVATLETQQGLRSRVEGANAHSLWHSRPHFLATKLLPHEVPASAATLCDYASLVNSQHASALIVARMGGHSDAADALVAAGAVEHDDDASDPLILPHHEPERMPATGELERPPHHHASGCGLPTVEPGGGGAVCDEAAVAGT